MLNRIALLIMAFAATPALAQTTPGDLTGPPVATSDLVPVAIDTSLGRIVVALDRLHAPITAGNFLRYVDTHRLDGEAFYRALRVGDGGLIGRQSEKGLDGASRDGNAAKLPFDPDINERIPATRPD